MGKFDASVESQSGVGSSLRSTAVVREKLPVLIRELGVRSFLDAPCGDFNWMKEVDLGVEKYIGLELSLENVINNKERYSHPGREFVAGDVVWSDLPKVDMILCRDCLVHLPFRAGLMALHNFKRSGSKYLVATTFPSVMENFDCALWDWRRLNLELPPFYLGPPERIIDEQGPRPDEQGKSLGVWFL
jgi:hypothetical protein